MIKDEISRHSMEMTAAQEYNKELSGQLEAAVTEREQLKWTVAATHEFLQNTVKQFHDQVCDIHAIPPDHGGRCTLKLKKNMLVV
jgi:hypothetical protein